eukprot:PhF_6_TR5735/c0_g1_i1/m.8448
MIVHRSVYSSLLFDSSRKDRFVPVLSYAFNSLHQSTLTSSLPQNQKAKKINRSTSPTPTAMYWVCEEIINANASLLKLKADARPVDLTVSLTKNTQRRVFSWEDVEVLASFSVFQSNRPRCGYTGQFLIREEIIHAVTANKKLQHTPYWLSADDAQALGTDVFPGEKPTTVELLEIVYDAKDVEGLPIQHSSTSAPARLNAWTLVPEITSVNESDESVIFQKPERWVSTTQVGEHGWKVRDGAVPLPVTVSTLFLYNGSQLVSRDVIGKVLKR